MQVLDTQAKAPGKVNLYLAVGNPREDGYHPLATLFSSVNIYETVTARDAQEQGITLSLNIVPDSLVDQQHRAGEFDVSCSRRYGAGARAHRERSQPAPAY